MVEQRASGEGAGRHSLRAMRRYIGSYYDSRRRRSTFRSVRTYCLFVGHARGGGSLVGALLDAHPKAIVADEVDVFDYVARGFDRDQIFSRLLAASRVQARWRRTPSWGRSLAHGVPGQWQGRFSALEVIGSSRAGLTTRALAANPELLERWRKVLGGPAIKLIQVTRNPYDAISSMILRSGRSFASGIERYFSNCAAVEAVAGLVPAEDILLVRYERFIDDSRPGLRRVLGFLGLDPLEDYLASAAATIKPPSIDRLRVPWTPPMIEEVEGHIEEYPFLAGYRYERDD